MGITDLKRTFYATEENILPQQYSKETNLFVSFEMADPFSMSMLYYGCMPARKVKNDGDPFSTTTYVRMFVPS